MSSLLSWIIQAINVVVNNGMFLKLWSGSNTYSSLYLVLVYILCFFALIFIFKKFYRW